MDKFLGHAKTGHRQQLGLSLQDFQTLPQKVGTENCLTWSTRNVCENVSSLPTGLFSKFSSKDSSSSPFPAGQPPAAPFSFTQLFFKSLLSHTLCSQLERFSTTNNLSNLWCSKLQQVSTYAFCSWDDIFTQERNGSSPNNLSKSPKSHSPLSSNRFIVWKFYLSWSNHLVVEYVSEMKVGGFSKHQNNTSDTDRNERYFFSQMGLSDRSVYYEKSFWAGV